MLRVGLTGGTGAGKSTLARRLAERGAVLVDADALARDVLAPGSDGLRAVVERFGPQVLTGDGALDRAVLARLAFADPDRRRALEAITHPLIAARTAAAFAAAPPDAVVVHDVPLLVELAMGDRYHLVVVVDAPEQLRVARLAGRGMAPDDARARIRAQATTEQRRAAADVWLDNSLDPDGLARDADRLWDDRLVPFERAVRARQGRRSGREGPARLVPHDPTWAPQAARLAARIARAAGPVGAGVDHVGSTSVPGLAAKPVLDLQLGVRGLADDAARAALVERLCEAGFPGDGAWQQDEPQDDEPDPRRWRKLYHRTADPGSLPVHLHVREAGSPGWRLALLTRDWWRADAQARAEYEAFKRATAAEHTGDPTTEGYAAAKEPWFTSAWPRARDWAERTGWRAPAQPQDHAPGR